MMNILSRVFDWSEVWAPLIPLAFLIAGNKPNAILKPVVVYLWLALLLNLPADIIGDFKKEYHFPQWLQSNTPIYNIHSVVRFACFSYFFISLPQPFFKTLKKAIAVLTLVFIAVDLIFFEDLFLQKHLSDNLLSVEAYVLLIYCMLYYLGALMDEDDAAFRGSTFWAVTGLCIYVVINFFVFLFYVPMIDQDLDLAINIWNVHNVAYIILCLFITKALHATT